jgi:HTH-type transcriptional regulator / antitoxin MqsA
MNSSTTTCPICGADTLTAERYDGDVNHNGQSLTIRGLERSRCSTCGADPVMTDQIRRNQLVIADAKRRRDGLLTGDQIRNGRNILGLSQPEAARIFGGGENAFSKYERGEVIQSVPMDRLFRLLIELPYLLPRVAVYSGTIIRAARSHAKHYEQGPSETLLVHGGSSASWAGGNKVNVLYCAYERSAA